jgi:hypothetical protein
VLDRRALLRVRPPRAARGDVHGQPQPGAVQRDQDVPRRSGPDRPRHGPRRDPRPHRGRRRAHGRHARHHDRAGPSSTPTRPTS